MDKSRAISAATVSGTVPEELDDPEREFSDEDDFELLIGFDADDAKKRLFNLNNSITLTIEAEQQREMRIEVGINVSSENPWKQISKQFLEDNLSSDTYEMKVLQEKLKEITDDLLLLIGYVPHLSDETKDTFVIYLDELTCKEASEIVKRLEAVERKKIKSSIIKYPRPYQSMGSENEVNYYVKERRTNLVDVELQSVYPMRHSSAKLQFRLADDVRDGYAELVPSYKDRFENVHRKLVNCGIQSAPMKITEEQQTDPTFPTNAWSQYLYEMEEEKNKEVEIEPLEKDEEEERIPLMIDRRKSKAKQPPPVEVIEEVEHTVSKQVVELLETLEFNEVDMYRNDYPFISKKDIQKYQTPYLEEVCCFVNIAKCKGRYVTSLDWHPEYSGVCVVAYGFHLKSKIIKDDEEQDDVNRTIIESNPVLVWSFDDSLYPKLELESIREISCISFCPYDGNIIIGGTVNGQIIIWDISDRIRKVEAEELLTPEQTKNRSEIRNYLNWSKIDESNKIVLPAAISSIEQSHEDAITSIKWLARNYFCTPKGYVKEDRENKKEHFRHFVTSSMDGTVMFWNLDWSPTDDHAKGPKISHKVNLPEELREETSPFKMIDQIFHPHFILKLGRPVTSFTFDDGAFSYDPLIRQHLYGNDITKRVHHKPMSEMKQSFNPKMVVGTSIGELCLYFWDGTDFSQGALLNEQQMQQELYASIHDGPITHVHRNPFLPQVFISLGGFILALWHDEYKEYPIFWRRRKSRLTAFRWSLDRPSVFFLTCEDGSLEIWDLNSRIDIPSMVESLGGNILTELLQHKLSLCKRILAVADFNTNLRMFTIPTAFVQQVPNEIEILRTFVNDEVQRKKDQESWKNEWFEKNKDIIEAKQQAELQIRDEMAMKEKDKRELDDYKVRQAEADAKRRASLDAKRMVFDLPQKLDKKWDEQNYKRLLKIMMDRKKVDQTLLEKQTKILKDRMAYNENKKIAIKQSFAKIDEDLSTIRARLVPVEEYKATREELVSDFVDSILESKPIYASLEEVALKKIKQQPERTPMTLPEILKRCSQNRELLNQSLGGGVRAKFERYKNARLQQKISRYSSISQIPGGSRSVTFSNDLKDYDPIEANTPNYL